MRRTASSRSRCCPPGCSRDARNRRSSTASSASSKKRANATEDAVVRMQNRAQLIAYVDRLSGGTVRQLQHLLDGPLRGLFGGVHLLPFFHPIDGADAGFDPIDHTQVDPRLGTWGDV